MQAIYKYFFGFFLLNTADLEFESIKMHNAVKDVNYSAYFHWLQWGCNTHLVFQVYANGENYTVSKKEKSMGVIHYERCFVLHFAHLSAVCASKMWNLIISRINSSNSVGPLEGTPLPPSSPTFWKSVERGIKTLNNRVDKVCDKL